MPANIINGTSGDDVLTGTAGADVFQLAQGGNDTASGLDANDTFVMGATLTAADTLDGGAGNDIVLLNGNYATGLILGASTLTGIERINLAAGHSYNLTTNDANVATGQSLTINGGALGAADSFTFDGSAESGGSFTISGGAGSDNLTGGARNDSFVMGAVLTAADAIHGGAGNDIVLLNGDYSAGLTLGASTLTGVERMSLAAGHNYRFITNDANLAAGQSLSVNASALGAGNTLIFNGSAESNGSFVFNCGAGNDHLITGAGGDSFHLESGGNDFARGNAGNDIFFMGAALTAADTLEGDGGSDLVNLAGDYTAAHAVVFGATTMTGVETIALGAGHSYDLTLNSATVATGATLTVDASALGASNDLTFDASQQTQGDLAIIAGQGFNIYEMGANFHAQDSLTGESGGFNELKLDGDTTVVMTAQTLVHFNEISVAGNHAYNITANDAAAVANLPFTIDSSTLTSGGSLTYDGSAETDGQLEFVCGGGQYNLTGSHDSDEFDLSDSVSAAAVATITGGPGGDTILAGGTDTFVYNSPSDSTSTIHDFLHFIDFSKDHFHLVGTSVGAVNGGVSGQINSGGLFDSNLASVIGSSMGAHDAIVVTANDGTDNGKVFLVVDADGSASYTAGSDYVFEIAFFSGSVTTATFI